MRYLTSTTFFTLTYVSLVFTLEDVLRWQSTGVPQSDSYFESDSGKPFVIDGSVSYQVSVKIVNVLTVPVINFRCFVHTLQDKSKITEAHFCRIYNNESPMCILLANKTNDITLSSGITFRVEYDPSTGANITSTWSKGKPDSSGLYYCQFNNQRSAVKSATLDIQDLMIVSQAIKGNPSITLTILEPITPPGLPLNIDCSGVDKSKFTDDVNFNIPTPISWKLCQVDDQSASSTCTRALADSANSRIFSLEQSLSRYSQNTDGSLTIFSLKASTFDKYALICYNPANLRAFHSIFGGGTSSRNMVSPLVIDGTVKYSGSPVATGPLRNSYRLREGRRALPYVLMAQYRADYSTIKHKWTKNGLALPESTIDTNFQFHLGLPTDPIIQRHMAGLYRLHISYNGNDDFLVFSFDVSILYPPSFKGTFIPEEYIMESGSLSTSWAFENAESIHISINGADIDDKSEKGMVDSWEKEKIRVGLSKLQFSISPLPVNVKDVVVYKVQEIPVGYSHLITFEGKNSVGMARASKYIRVVRLPEFIDTPNNYHLVDRTEFPESHSFVCSLDPVIHDEILAMGVILQQKWYVGDEDVTGDKWNGIFSIDNDTTLTLHNPSKKKNILAKLKDELSNTTVICSIEIYKEEEGRRVPLYNSKFDGVEDLKLKLSARVSFAKELFIAGASINWLWAIIVAIILIFIIATLITYLCLRNKEGATYLVDEQERAQGNDPEKEIEEKEIFHTYERIEDMESGSRLSYGNESVGIHSEGDKDVELYDLDPGKFTEEGSFIYGYTHANGTTTKQPGPNYSQPHV